MDALAKSLNLDVALLDFVVLLIPLIVVLAVMYAIRRRVGSQGLKDLIGVTMAFLVLLAATGGFIVGEHALA